MYFIITNYCFIGVGKTLVFLEGGSTSSDRKLFSNIFPEHGGEIKFIPSQSVENLPKLNAAILSILGSGVGWLKFYLIRDRDYLDDNAIIKHKALCYLPKPGESYVYY